MKYRTHWFNFEHLCRKFICEVQESFLSFSFGKLHSIKSNSSCIYINYVLRFHLSAAKMTNMEEGRGEERGTIGGICLCLPRPVI